MADLANHDDVVAAMVVGADDAFKDRDRIADERRAAVPVLERQRVAFKRLLAEHPDTLDPKSELTAETVTDQIVELLTKGIDFRVVPPAIK